MPSNLPHDKAGKQCTVCGNPFDKTMAAFTIPRRKYGLIVHELTCKQCMQDHHSKGE